jgi:hypothetical protein
MKEPAVCIDIYRIVVKRVQENVKDFLILEVNKNRHCIGRWVDIRTDLAVAANVGIQTRSSTT